MLFGKCSSIQMKTQCEFQGVEEKQKKLIAYQTVRKIKHHFSFSTI